MPPPAACGVSLSSGLTSLAQLLSSCLALLPFIMLVGAVSISHVNYTAIEIPRDFQ
jgi:hypothetical protein